MTSHNRVLKTLSGDLPDRVPLNVFAGWNPGIRQKVESLYGGVEAFNERFRIDIVTGVLPRFPYGRFDDAAAPAHPDEIAEFLGLTPLDPRKEPVADMRCDGDLFSSVREAVATADGKKAVFAHAWGVFELSQFLFERAGRPGTQEALLSMLADRDSTREVYRRLGEWTADCVEAAVHAGADVIELSDDWGQQNTMLFSPDLWWDLVYPPTKQIVERARQLDTPVVIHSDGDVSLVLDGIRDLAVDGLHPVQESAGMNPVSVREALGPNVCIMGGLDTITALPVMNADEVAREVDRVFSLLKETGPFIFCGSHMFQDDSDLDVIASAYDRAAALAPYA